MARYTAELVSSLPQEEVFSYLSDFSNAQEWDPGTVSAARLDAGALKRGSRFALRASMLGRESDIEYTIVDFERPRRVTLRGENATALSTDTITFDRSGKGTRIAYAAELHLKGPMRVFEPLLGLVFRKVGDRALAGLGNTLADMAASDRPPQRDS